MIKPKAILLDFYGTVVEEDESPIILTCRQIVKSSNKSISLSEVVNYWWDAFGDLFTNSYNNSFQLEKKLGQLALISAIKFFDARLDEDKLIKDLSEYWDEYWGKPAIFPESRNVLAKINEYRIPICLVSNIDNAVLDSALKHNQLNFDMIVTSEDCRSYKPRPEMFQKALSILNLSNSNVLHIGDSLRSDVKGAKLMEIPVLWINRKKQSVNQPEKPDFESSDLSGVIDLIGL
ncbi:MAG: HAD family hydrolase [Candidatus Poribacteria bacterium]